MLKLKQPQVYEWWTMLRILPTAVTHRPSGMWLLVYHTEAWNKYPHFTTTRSLIARSRGHHGTHLGPTGPRWAPCWPHGLCHLGIHMYDPKQNDFIFIHVHWSLLRRVQFITSQYRFNYWLGAEQDPSHCIIQCSLRSMMPYGIAGPKCVTWKHIYWLVYWLFPVKWSSGECHGTSLTINPTLVQIISSKRVWHHRAWLRPTLSNRVWLI